MMSFFNVLLFMVMSVCAWQHSVGAFDDEIFHVQRKAQPHFTRFNQAVFFSPNTHSVMRYDVANMLQTIAISPLGRIATRDLQHCLETSMNIPIVSPPTNYRFIMLQSVVPSFVNSYRLIRNELVQVVLDIKVKANASISQHIDALRSSLVRLLSMLRRAIAASNPTDQRSPAEQIFPTGHADLVLIARSHQQCLNEFQALLPVLEQALHTIEAQSRALISAIDEQSQVYRKRMKAFSACWFSCRAKETAMDNQYAYLSALKRNATRVGQELERWRTLVINFQVATRQHQLYVDVVEERSAVGRKQHALFQSFSTGFQTMHDTLAPVLELEEHDPDRVITALSSLGSIVRKLNIMHSVLKQNYSIVPFWESRLGHSEIQQFEAKVKVLQGLPKESLVPTPTTVQPLSTTDVEQDYDVPALFSTTAVADPVTVLPATTEAVTANETESIDQEINTTVSTAVSFEQIQTNESVEAAPTTALPSNDDSSDGEEVIKDYQVHLSLTTLLPDVENGSTQSTTTVEPIEDERNDYPEDCFESFRNRVYVTSTTPSVPAENEYTTASVDVTNGSSYQPTTVSFEQTERSESVKAASTTALPSDDDWSDDEEAIEDYQVNLSLTTLLPDAENSTAQSTTTVESIEDERNDYPADYYENLETGVYVTSATPSVPAENEYTTASVDVTNGSSYPPTSGPSVTMDHHQSTRLTTLALDSHTAAEVQNTTHTNGNRYSTTSVSGREYTSDRSSTITTESTTPGHVITEAIAQEFARMELEESELNMYEDADETVHHDWSPRPVQVTPATSTASVQNEQDFEMIEF